jgi:hypothetical protein
MATEVHWAKAHSGGLCRLMPPGSRPERGHRVVHDQCMWRGAVLNGAAAVYRRRGLHLDLLHGSLYKPRQQDLDEVARKGVLTGDAVRAAVADDVEGGNDFKVGEGAPSSAPELHMSDADSRPCLIGDEK